jgi:tRNA dimethylallyltransferase
MNNMQQLALIGPTASGKTALSIKIAQQMNATILSIDSLSIYKEIDIVSAKPTLAEREGIEHFGLDYIYPNESFNVTTFIKLYHEVYNKASQEGKNLVIVGGTSFYLKMLIEGISMLPNISESTKDETKKHLLDLKKTYQWLYTIDPVYMAKIATNDPYRIEKALHIYLETTLIPTEYFKQFPPQPTITTPLPIYQIETQREQLRERISLRTNMMAQDGLIDEICALEKKYSRTPNCMKAIGIKETLAYLDGIYNKKSLIEKITTNTARLAKRQKTFNNSQFENVIKGSVEELEKKLLL